MDTIFYLKIVTLLFILFPISISGDTRIIGGQIANIEDFPFMVSLQVNGEHFCGGTILNKRWILTAAHCTYPATIFTLCTITVIAGISDCKDRNNENCQRTRSKRCFIHQRYSEKPIRNDISLILLRKRFSITDTVKPVTLGSADNNNGSDLVKLFNKCTAVGWGLTSLKPCWSCRKNPLRFTELTLISLKDCKKKWTTSFWTIIKDTQICTLDPFWEHGVYKGDSGGPLLCGDAQQGIMSFVGNPAISANLPNVFTRVDKYRSWIRQTIRSGACCCSGYTFFFVFTLFGFYVIIVEDLFVI